MVLGMGSSYGCVVTAEHKLECVGSTAAGRGETPADLGKVRSVAAAQHHVCVHLLDETVRCWSRHEEFLPPANLGKVRNVFASGCGNCALLQDDKSLRCWGFKWDADKTFEGKIDAVALGCYGMCAISEGKVHCWWHTSRTSAAGWAVPSAVTNTTLRTLSSGTYGICAISTEDKLYCWGEASKDMDGRQQTHDNVKLVGTGWGNDVCAVLNDDTVNCWDVESGFEHCGNCMDPPAGKIPSGVRSISVGYLVACVVNTDDAVRCWGKGGRNHYPFGSGVNVISVGAVAPASNGLSC